LPFRPVEFAAEAIGSLLHPRIGGLRFKRLQSREDFAAILGQGRSEAQRHQAHGFAAPQEIIDRALDFDGVGLNFSVPSDQGQNDRRPKLQKAFRHS
jgi:hypothetical protein